MLAARLGRESAKVRERGAARAGNKARGLFVALERSALSRLRDGGADLRHLYPEDKARPRRQDCGALSKRRLRQDLVTGLKSALDGGSAKIVAEVSYELSDPTIASQIVKLKESRADVLMDFTTPKFAAQAIRRIGDLEWKPLQFVVSLSNSVESVLKPAGLENAQGLYTTQKASDPGWANDSEVKEYVAFMEKWASHASPTVFIALSG
jgi:substrate-binding family protein